jgi:hypothetical protein
LLILLLLQKIYFAIWHIQLASNSFLPLLVYGFGAIVAIKSEKNLLCADIWRFTISVLFVLFRYSLAVLTFGSAVMWISAYPLTLLPLATLSQKK